MENPLIADLSAYSIRIDSGFTGTRLLLFGARAEGGDVVVVIRGPDKAFDIRKKERVGGMWVNRQSVVLDKVPFFYAAASSKPLERIRSGGLFTGRNIGDEGVLARAGMKARAGIDMREFMQAFLDQQRLRRLYAPDIRLQFMGETLFKASIDFPDIIAEGKYTAETYLFSEGALIGMQAVPILVEKTGLDAFVHRAAHRAPLLYGLAAIAIAVGVGWAASRAFEKI